MEGAWEGGAGGGGGEREQECRSVRLRQNRDRKEGTERSSCFLQEIKKRSKSVEVVERRADLNNAGIGLAGA